MNKYLAIPISLLVLSLFITCSPVENKIKSHIAFTHINVIPMDREQLLEDYTVIVSDGKIVDLGPSTSLKIPENTLMIEGKDKFIIPALSDMHIHLEGDAWNIMYPDTLKYSKEELDFRDILFLYLANGITLVDVMSAFPEHIAIRDSINKHKMPGPRLILSRMIDGAGKAWPPPISSWVNNSAEAKEAVIEAHQLGYDRLKVYSFLDKSCYDTIMSTAKELNMPVDGHIPLSVTVEHVVESGQNMIVHSEEVLKFVEEAGPEQIEYYSTLLTENGIWMTATLTTTHNLISLFDNDQQELSKPGTEYMHPMGLDIWYYINDNLYKPIPEAYRQGIREGYTSFQLPFTNQFYKKGGKLLAGTDVLIPPNLPGFALHEELEELVKAGLSPYESLKVSTTNGWEFLGELETAGTIEIGKDANLVLLDENPLENISNTRMIFGVMSQNQWISRNEIDKRLEEIEESYDLLRKGKSN